MIDIQQKDDERFLVTVSDGTETRHEVEVPTDFWRKLTDGEVSKEALLRESFEFLLEREPSTSILSSFEISTISRYFPEYENEIRNRV